MPRFFNKSTFGERDGDLRWELVLQHHVSLLNCRGRMQGRFRTDA